MRTTATTPVAQVGPPGRGELVGLYTLWTLAGVAGLFTLLGMLSVGIFVLPFAVALLGLALWLTLRGPGRWPALAGLGVALALGIAWMGVVLGSSSSPSSGSCTGTPDGVTTCVDSTGVPFDPSAFSWAAAAPWLVVAAVVVGLALIAFVVLTRHSRRTT